MGIWVGREMIPAFGPSQSLAKFSIWDLFFAVIFAFVFIFLAVKFKRFGLVFYKIFLSLIIFMGAQAVFSIWVSPLISILLAVVLLFLYWRLNNVILQNVAMILAFAGIGSVIGLTLEPSLVVWILVAFSAYDLLAVYLTGHMIKLARSMVESRAVFGFVVPEKISGIKEKMVNVRPGEGFMILGSGDVILPMLLSVSLLRISLLAAIIVALFSFLGLFLMHLIFINQKVRRPMAALPPIAGLAILGYLAVILIKF